MNTKEQNGLKSVIIANPIYDTVFKKLMENMRIAKFFLSTILGEQITDITPLPQEFTYKKDSEEEEEEEDNNFGKIPLAMLRIDFMATVKTENGGMKKILIEVQKSWDMSDVSRFRRYLGEQYTKKSVVKDKKVMLPITTIYILGNNLAGIERPCIKIRRVYTDSMNNEELDAKSDFMELLTHDCHVIQTSRITDVRYTTNLEKLLSIFEQAYFTNSDSQILKVCRYQPEDEDMELITSVLQEIAASSENRERMDIEERRLEIIEDRYDEKLRVLEEKDKALEEKDKALEEKAKVLEEKDKALEEKDKALEEKDKSLEEKDKSLEEKDKSLEEQAKQIAELKRLLQSKQGE